MSKNYENQNIRHIKDNGVEYIEFKILDKYRYKLRHCITLKYGGVSKYEYSSLNFRIIGNDLKESVNKNLSIICNKVGIEKENVFKGDQDHTDNILVIDNENKKNYRFEDISREKIDGYICKDKNIATLVTTADCNPIIIYDIKKNIVSNIHSGWKGTIKQIYLKAIKIMNETFECKNEDLIVCIGPSINKCCFSSEDEKFKENFLNIWKNEKEYITYDKENQNKFYIDLPFLIKQDLLKVGIKEENIVLSNICTLCNKEDFFSYRNTTIKKEKDYGTFATIVELI